MAETEIKVGLTYSSNRWKGDRKVQRFEQEKGAVVVHYIDLRTSRIGNSPLELFASNAERLGLVANI